MLIEVVSVIVTSISILVTVRALIKESRAKKEVVKLRSFLAFKKFEEFAVIFRNEYKCYSGRVERAKWKEVVQGKDIVGNMDSVLTEFNTYLPQIEYQTKQRLCQSIDEAKKEFVKVRKGDEESRDRNIQQLNRIDRMLNEEIEKQRKDFMEIL
ncbi:MAG: hypothetical protein IJU08_05370 [Bacteroidales bacterium]|nr:hypothetical protein [Bacteroidales bacterium]